MEPTKPPIKSICPLCNKVPDVYTEGHYPFIWNGMTGTYICEYCHIELAIEFYEDNSLYFNMASRLLNVDTSECRKRYLDFVITTSETILSESTVDDDDYAGYLMDRIEKSKRQVLALEQFLESKCNATSQMELGIEYEKLKKALSVPAFDTDFAIPNLIMVEFE